MAWSEAARKAAAEARKRKAQMNSWHKGARQQFSRSSAFNISADTSPAGRSEMARRLVRYRKQLKDASAYSEGTLHETVSGAAASTRLRNLKRQASRNKNGLPDMYQKGHMGKGVKPRVQREGVDKLTALQKMRLISLARQRVG